MSAEAANHPLLLEASLDEADTGEATDRPGSPGGRFTSLQMTAFALAVGGIVALAIGWFGVSDKVEVWEQLPYLISGGLGGAVLIGFGITAYVANEHAEDRRTQTDLEARIGLMEAKLGAMMNRRLDELEMAVAAELDDLAARVNGTRARS